MSRVAWQARPADSSGWREQAVKHAYSITLLYVLRQAVESNWIAAACNASTISHFTADKFREMRVWMPDARRQATIADYLDGECKRLDNLQETATRAIELVKERRSALISATVAGGLDTGDDDKEQRK